MDRSLINQTPDLSPLEESLQERILARHAAVLGQVDYFVQTLALPKQMEKDGTRVTEVDEKNS